jgi:tRNA(Ile)-lysidine synthase
MTSSFEDTLWKSSQHLFEGIDRVLFAVSGGADSMAMAHVLHRLAQGGGLSCGFVIGHVNHCLRGAESDADEAFVTQFGQSLDIPVISQRIDVQEYAESHKLSIETAGRVVRLKALARMAEENGCDAIATAHHKDDLAETMIHRLMRGTGLRGLCGIWPVSEVYGAEFIRPMLETSRNEIVQYCREKGVNWQEDASNQNIGFTRNRIRHYLLPLLKDSAGATHPRGPDTMAEKLSSLSRSCRRFQLFTDKLAQSIFEKGRLGRNRGCFAIEWDYLKDAACWVFYEVVRRALVELGVGLRRYKREHFQAVGELVRKKRGRLTLPENMTAATVDGELVLFKGAQAAWATSDPPYNDEAVQLQIIQTVEFGPWRVSSKLLNAEEVNLDEFLKTKDDFVEWFDADKIAGPLEIRRREEGDRFWPIGAKGLKKVARFLIDAQLNEKIKKQTFVVADTEKILWVTPLRLSEQVKITPQTRRILEIRISEKK